MRIIDRKIIQTTIGAVLLTWGFMNVNFNLPSSSGMPIIAILIGGALILRARN